MIDQFLGLCLYSIDFSSRYNKPHLETQMAVIFSLFEKSKPTSTIIHPNTSDPNCHWRNFGIRLIEKYRHKALSNGSKIAKFGPQHWLDNQKSDYEGLWWCAVPSWHLLSWTRRFDEFVGGMSLIWKCCVVIELWWAGWFKSNLGGIVSGMKETLLNRLMKQSINLCTLDVKLYGGVTRSFLTIYSKH